MEENGEKVTNKPRKPRKPRVLTKKRKEQNRIHQQLYREKQKRLALEVQSSEAVENPAPASSSNPNTESTAEIAEMNTASEEQPWMEASSTLFANLIDSGLEIGPELGFDQFEGILSEAYNGEVDLTGDGFDPLHAATEPQSVADQGPESVNIVNTIMDRNQRSQDGQIELLKDNRGEIEIIKTNRAGVVKRVPLRQVLTLAMNALCSQKSFKQYAIKVSDSEVIWEDSLGRDDFCILRERLRNWVNFCPNVRSMFDEVESYVANPVINHIKLHQIDLLAACIANCSMLGFDIEMIPRTYSSSHRRVISPIWATWHRLKNTATVMATYSTVGRDLRPCVEQVEQKHGLYIDMFPFPDFRRRIISARDIRPPLFSEEELCHDIDNGGLVCWGSRGTGTPWDMRSWEARPWFLKKWWMLTGGTEGEMYAQSKWYWDIQGLEEE